MYIKLFEEFEPKEIVTVNGEIGQVISEDGDMITIRFFKLKEIKSVHRNNVKPQIKCLSQCNKKVVGSGDNRYVKCFYCGKEQRFN